MTTTTVVENGVTFIVTKNDAGEIITKAAADPWQPLADKPIRAKLQQLINAPVPLTQNQRDRALQLIIGFLVGQSDA